MVGELELLWFVVRSISRAYFIFTGSWGETSINTDVRLETSYVVSCSFKCDFAKAHFATFPHPKTVI